MDIEHKLTIIQPGDDVTIVINGKAKVINTDEPYVIVATDGGKRLKIPIGLGVDVWLLAYGIRIST